MLICFLCGNIYIYIRAMQRMRSMYILVRILFTVLFWLMALMLFITMSLRHSNVLPAIIYKTMYAAGSIWLVFVLYMTMALVFFDIIKALFARSMKNGVIYALGITLSILIAGHINYLSPRVNRIDIPVEKHIIGDTVTIVGVSDLHLGHGTGKERLKKFVDMINAEKPDIVLIAGDLIDNSTVPLHKEKMYEELNTINSSMGIYMAPGNHEYISGIDNSYRFVNMTPIKMLADSVVTLPNGIQLLCRDDVHSRGRMAIDELVAKADKSKVMILIDHQPYDIAIKNELGIDIQLSGHTHNGQIWPGNLITDRLFEQSNGYRKWSNSHVYVSSGLSLWGPPLRIGTNCDMVVFKVYSTAKLTD